MTIIASQDTAHAISDVKLYELLGSARMRPYLREAGENRANALKLYRWNAAISGAFYQGLHVFEVVLRNSMDAHLKNWNASQTNDRGGSFDAEWCSRPAPMLGRILGPDRATAIARARTEFAIKKRNFTPSHDDIIAQMSLGTWRFLLPSKSDTGKAEPWEAGLKHAFPHRTRPVRELIDSIDGVYRIRNRVAHLEPLTRANLPAQYRNIQTVLGDIEPKAREWFVSSSPIPKLLDARPFK
jgi:hypothetical protein